QQDERLPEQAGGGGQHTGSPVVQAGGAALQSCRQCRQGLRVEGGVRPATEGSDAQPVPVHVQAPAEQGQRGRGSRGTGSRGAGTYPPPAPQQEVEAGQCQGRLDQDRQAQQDTGPGLPATDQGQQHARQQGQYEMRGVALAQAVVQRPRGGEQEQQQPCGTAPQAECLHQQPPCKQ